MNSFIESISKVKTIDDLSSTIQTITSSNSTISPDHNSIAALQSVTHKCKELLLQKEEEECQKEEVFEVFQIGINFCSWFSNDFLLKRHSTEPGLDIVAIFHESPKILIQFLDECVFPRIILSVAATTTPSRTIIIKMVQTLLETINGTLPFSKVAQNCPLNLGRFIAWFFEQDSLFFVSHPHQQPQQGYEDSTPTMISSNEEYFSLVSSLTQFISIPETAMNNAKLLVSFSDKTILYIILGSIRRFNNKNKNNEDKDCSDAVLKKIVQRETDEQIESVTHLLKVLAPFFVISSKDGVTDKSLTWVEGLVSNLETASSSCSTSFSFLNIISFLSHLVSSIPSIRSHLASPAFTQRLVNCVAEITIHHSLKVKESRNNTSTLGGDDVEEQKKMYDSILNFIDLHLFRSSTDLVSQRFITLLFNSSEILAFDEPSIISLLQAKNMEDVSTCLSSLSTRNRSPDKKIFSHIKSLVLLQKFEQLEFDDEICSKILTPATVSAFGEFMFVLRLNLVKFLDVMFFGWLSNPISECRQTLEALLDFKFATENPPIVHAAYVNALIEKLEEICSDDGYRKVKTNKDPTLLLAGIANARALQTEPATLIVTFLVNHSESLTQTMNNFERDSLVKTIKRAISILMFDSRFCSKANDVLKVFERK